MEKRNLKMLIASLCVVTLIVGSIILPSANVKAAQAEWETIGENGWQYKVEAKINWFLQGKLGEQTVSGGNDFFDVPSINVEKATRSHKTYLKSPNYKVTKAGMHLITFKVTSNKYNEIKIISNGKEIYKSTQKNISTYLEFSVEDEFYIECSASSSISGGKHFSNLKVNYLEVIEPESIDDTPIENGVVTGVVKEKNKWHNIAPNGWSFYYTNTSNKTPKFEYTGGSSWSDLPSFNIGGLAVGDTLTSQIKSPSYKVNVTGKYNIGLKVEKGEFTNTEGYMEIYDQNNNKLYESGNGKNTFNCTLKLKKGQEIKVVYKDIRNSVFYIYSRVLDIKELTITEDFNVGTSGSWQTIGNNGWQYNVQGVDDITYKGGTNLEDGPEITLDGSANNDASFSVKTPVYTAPRTGYYKYFITNTEEAKPNNATIKVYKTNGTILVSSGVVASNDNKTESVVYFRLTEGDCIYAEYSQEKTKLNTKKITAKIQDPKVGVVGKWTKVEENGWQYFAMKDGQYVSNQITKSVDVTGGAETDNLAIFSLVKNYPFHEWDFEVKTSKYTIPEDGTYRCTLKVFDQSYTSTTQYKVYDGDNKVLYSTPYKINTYPTVGNQYTNYPCDLYFKKGQKVYAYYLQSWASECVKIIEFDVSKIY